MHEKRQTGRSEKKVWLLPPCSSLAKSIKTDPGSFLCLDALTVQ